MNDAILIDHRIAFGCQRPAQRHIRVELAALIEINNTQPVGPSNLSRWSGPTSPRNIRNRVVFPLPLGPTNPTRSPAVMMKFNPCKQFAARRFHTLHALQFDQPLGLSIGGREIDQRRPGSRPVIQIGEFFHQLSGLADACFGFSRPRLRTPPQPFDLRMHQVFQRFLPLRLRVQELLFLLQRNGCSALLPEGIRRDKCGSTPPSRWQHSPENSGRD